jgi:hypothetical protein
VKLFAPETGLSELFVFGELTALFPGPGAAGGLGFCAKAEAAEIASAAVVMITIFFILLSSLCDGGSERGSERLVPTRGNLLLRELCLRATVARTSRERPMPIKDQIKNYAKKLVENRPGSSALGDMVGVPTPLASTHVIELWDAERLVRRLDEQVP